jgi:hypothetical protein
MGTVSPAISLMYCIIYFNFSLGRQGSSVTFDPSLGPVSGSGSLLSQHSESLSLTSDGEIPGDPHSYSDSEKSGKLLQGTIIRWL